MKIVVCVKRVPDTATKIKVAANGKTIDTTGVEYVVSPYDELAVEHAVRIKEKLPNVEVVVVSMGVNDEKILRLCLAMGADRGILLQDDAPDRDPYAIAQALAGVVKEEKPDLLLFGIKAVDVDGAQVGSLVSTLVDMPFLFGAAEMEATDKKVKIQYELDGAIYSVEAALPCAVSIQKGSVEARISSLINIRKARTKPLSVVPAPGFSPTLSTQKVELPAQKGSGKIVGEGPDAVAELFRLLREEAKVL